MNPTRPVRIDARAILRAAEDREAVPQAVPQYVPPDRVPRKRRTADPMGIEIKGAAEAGKGNGQ